MGILKKSKFIGFVSVFVCLALLMPWVGAGTALACGEAGAMDQTVLLPGWNTLYLAILGAIIENSSAFAFMAGTTPAWMMQYMMSVIAALLMGQVMLASADGSAQVPMEAQEALSAYLKHKTLRVTADPDQSEKWSILGSAQKPGSAEGLAEALVLLVPVPAKGKLSEVDPALKPTDMLQAGDWQDQGNGLWSKTFSLKDKYRAGFNLAQMVWPTSLLKGASKTVPAVGPPLGAIAADDSVIVYISEN